jgi:uncharacterized protein (TIGR03435 family)
MSLDDFIQHCLRDRLNRPILNKTGIAGRFDFRLEYAPEDALPAPRDTASPAAEPSELAGPSIFTAFERQLGLKLQPAKAPGVFLVIDSIERPSAN